MATQALFYKQVVPVSLDAHADLCVDTRAGYAFCRNSNFVPLAGVEFEKAAWHFPIVFVEQDASFVPAAILGFGQHDNLYVDDDGQWASEYIPGYVRRYPFILANVSEAQTFTLCIDPTYAGCNTSDEGERLFLLGGARSGYLERMLAFVQQYHAEQRATAQFCEVLKSLELLEPMQAQVALNSGEKIALSGFCTVSRERLQAISAEELARLGSSSALEQIFLHLFSLANFGPMLDRHARRSGS